MPTRRSILGYLGPAVGSLVAGCSGSDGPRTEAPSTHSPTDTEPPREPDVGGSTPTETSTPTPTEDTDPTETSTPTSTETSAPILVLRESTIYTGPDDRKWIRSVVRNTSGLHHGRLKIDYTVRSGNGGIVDTQTTLIDLIPPGDTWLNYQLVLGSRREQAASVEAKLRAGNDPQAAPRLEEIDFSKTRLSKDYQSATEITGEVTNTGDAQSIYIIGLIYTESGMLRGSVGHILNDLKAGETRAFRAAIAAHRTPKDREAALPKTHQMYAFNGIP
jgi:hypothetical protein